MTTPEQALSILEKLSEELRKRQDDIQTFEAAYRGEFRLKFASDDFSDYFAKQYAGFSDNWTQVVADAPHERLEVTGIRLEGEDKGDKESWDRWIENEADYYSDLAWLNAIVAKRTFSLVWGDKDDKATLSWEHPSQAIVGYSQSTRKRVAGAKIWCDDDREYATLYLDDAVWKWQRTRTERASGLILPASFAGGGWVPRQAAEDNTWPLTNPLGVVPLVEHENKPQLLGEPISDIAGTLSMQHAINLIWAQLFTGLDSLTLPGRVVTGAERPTIPVLNSDGQEVGRKQVELKKLGRDRIYWLEDPQARIAEWTAGNYEVFTKVIDQAVGHISSQSRTPATYFMGGGSTIANVGDNSMLPLETGLVMRTKEKQKSYGRGVREDFRLMALVEGNTEKAAAIARGTVEWEQVSTRSEAEKADALSKKKSMGYPMRFLLEQDGLPSHEIDRVMDMIRDEASDPLLEAALREVVKPTQAKTDAVGGE